MAGRVTQGRRTGNGSGPGVKYILRKKEIRSIAASGLKGPGWRVSGETSTGLGPGLTMPGNSRAAFSLPSKDQDWNLLETGLITFLLQEVTESSCALVQRQQHSLTTTQILMAQPFAGLLGQHRQKLVGPKPGILVFQDDTPLPAFY